jgi:ankyrin repeat protein
MAISLLVRSYFGSEKKLDRNSIVALTSNFSLPRQCSSDYLIHISGCEYGLQEFVSCMLDSGADPNSISDECSSTPALLAAYSGHDKVLQVLIDHKQVCSKFFTLLPDF